MAGFGDVFDHLEEDNDKHCESEEHDEYSVDVEDWPEGSPSGGAFDALQKATIVVLLLVVAIQMASRQWNHTHSGKDKHIACGQWACQQTELAGLKTPRVAAAEINFTIH